MEERDLAEGVPGPQRPDLFLVVVVAVVVVGTLGTLAVPFVPVAMHGDRRGSRDDDVKVEALLALPDHRLARGVLEAVHGAEQRVPVLGAKRIENCDALARGCDGGDVERGLLRHHAAVGGKPALARGGSFSGAGILGTGAGVTGDRVGAAGVDEREPAAHPHL